MNPNDANTQQPLQAVSAGRGELSSKVSAAASLGPLCRVFTGGPQFDLVLAADEALAVPYTTAHSGLIVQIHADGELPTPAIQGSLLAPGFNYAIELQKQTYARIPAPHGDCTSMLRPAAIAGAGTLTECLLSEAYENVCKSPSRARARSRRAAGVF